MNFTTENIHRFHLWGAFTVDKPSKKYKGSTRKVYVLRPIITARRREDLPEALRRAIKWWGGKGMSAVYLQAEWMPGVRSIHRQLVTDAKRWRARRLVSTTYLSSLRCWCDDAIDATAWQAPSYYWRTRRWDGHLAKDWVKPYASIGDAMRHRPGGSEVLVQGNRRVTRREIDAVRAVETAAWEAPWRAVPCREVGSPYIKGFVTLPEDVAPGLREVVVDSASAPGDGCESETTTWRAPGLTHKLEVVEDGAPLFVSLQELPRPGERRVRVGDVLNPPPPPPGPPEHWYVLEHDHEAVQALALVAQANRWVVRRLPLEHGLDVMFACAHPDIEAVRAILIEEDKEDE